MRKARKQQKTRPDRLEYLGLLVCEFQEVVSADYRRQVLANLANFAYDPNNYSYLRQLNVVDLFLTHLSDLDEIIVQFAIAGLCNLALDPRNKDYIIKHNGIKIIIKLLEHKNENIVTSAITTLLFLITPESKQEITGLDTRIFMTKLIRGKNNRLKNLAQIFLEDYCSEQQINEALNILDQSVQEIPLPAS